MEAITPASQQLKQPGKSDSEIQYPLSDIDPRMKDEKWGLMAAKAIWADFGGIGYFNKRRESIIMNRLYRIGKQPQDMYMQRYNCSPGVVNPDESLASINWDIVSFVPNMMNQIRNTIVKRGFGIGVQAVNRWAILNREMEKFYNKAAQELSPFYNQMSQIAGADLTPAKAKKALQNPMPQNEMGEEMAVFNKLKEEVDMESAIWMYLQKNNFNGEIGDYVDDYVCSGFMGCKEYVEDGQIKMKRCIPENSVMEFGIDPYFRNSSYFGEVEQVTVGELKKLANGKWTDEQLYEIAKNKNQAWKFLFSDWLRDPTIGSFWHLKVSILRFQYRTYDFIARKKKKDKRGADKVYNDVTDFNAENVIKKEYECWYDGIWIVDTDKMVSWEKQKYQARPAYIKGESENFSSASSSYHFVAPGMYHGITMCPMDAVKPYADQYQFANIDYQRNNQAQIPSGIIFNLSAVASVPKKGGGTMEPLDAMEIIRKTGSGVVADRDTTGRPIANARLFEINPGSGFTQLHECVNLMLEQIQLAQRATGLSDATLGFTTEERASVRNTQMSAAASVNAIAHITEAIREMLKMAGMGMIPRIQQLRKEKPIIGSYGQAGSIARKYVDVGEGVTKTHYDMVAFERPDGQDMEKLNEALNAQYIKREQTGIGGITFADKIMVENIVQTGGNMKDAWLYLNYRMDIIKKEDAQREQEKMQQQMQMQQKGNQEAAQMAQQAKQMELEGKLQIEQLITEREKIKLEGMRVIEDIKTQRELMLAQLGIKGDVAVQSMVNDNQLKIKNKDVIVREKEIDAMKEIAEESNEKEDESE